MTIGSFHLVCLGWLIFRAGTVAQVMDMLRAVISPWPWWILSGANSLQETGALTVIAYAAPLLVVEYFQYKKHDLESLLHAPVWMRGTAYACMFYALILLGGLVDKPFIYFQF